MSIIQITGSGAYEQTQENNYALEYLRRNLTEHKEKSPLDHPDGSVTEEKLSSKLQDRIKGHERNIQELNDVKADKTDIYTKSEVNTALDNLKLKIDDLETNANELSVRINSKSDKAETYTKNQTDEKLNTKAGKSTTLSGYGITDAATIYQLENTSAIAKSANEKAVRNSQDIKILQADKADKATTLEGYGITDAYTKAETDNAVTNKVDKINGYGLASIIYDANHCVISVQRDDEEYSRDVDVYSKGELDGRLASKVDRPYIDTTYSEHISFEFSEYYNWEMRAYEARTISFTFGDGGYENDYTSGLSFDSGETPTAIDYTDSGILNWVGTDCVTSDGLSIFQPSPETHYDIVFYFNGRQFIGLVNGFVPATGNEAV